MVGKVLNKIVEWHDDLYAKHEFKTTPEEHYGGPKESNGPLWQYMPEESKDTFIKVFGSIWNTCVALAEEEAANKAAFEAGEWKYLGCSAYAIIEVPGSNDTIKITTPGVSGIPSSSPDDYLKEIERSQMELLELMLSSN
jgi:hypothetical protein